MNLDLDPFEDEYLDEASSAVCPRCQHNVHFGTLVVRDGVLISSSEETDDSAKPDA